MSQQNSLHFSLHPTLSWIYPPSCRMSPTQPVKLPVCWICYSLGKGATWPVRALVEKLAQHSHICESRVLLKILTLFFSTWSFSFAMQPHLPTGRVNGVSTSVTFFPLKYVHKKNPKPQTVCFAKTKLHKPFIQSYVLNFLQSLPPLQTLPADEVF